MKRAAPAFCLAFAGCAYVGEPMPPALNIPRPVAALTVEEVGSRIVMRFDPPQQTTEALPLQIRAIDLRVGPVEPAAWPGAATAVTVTENTGAIDAAPWIGKRIVAAVRVQSKQGKWSAWSPLAPLDVIEPLVTPAGVKAEAAPQGVRISWRDPARPGVSMRIERRSGERFAEAGVVVKGAEFIDQQARFGEEQQYRLTLVLGTARSETFPTPALTPVDTFAPAVPANLTAVTGLGSVELSWDRPAESDLAGFRIYRDGARIGPAEPVAAATFSDRTVQRGKTYRYAVSSVDQIGNESQPTAPVEITAPE
jgi:hypothetical protein